MSEIDFSAWEAPPPPEGLADAVVARMAEPEPVAAPAAPRRRWLFAASAAAVLAIAGGLWAVTRPPTYTLPTPAPVVGAATVDTRPRLAVLELDSGDRVGEQLTGLLRERVASLSSYRYVAVDKHFGDLAVLHDCTSEAPLCMNAIAKDLGVDSFVYGHITSRRDGYEIDVQRFADGRVAAEWYKHIPASEAVPPLADSIVATLFDLRGDTHVASACDADALTEHGNAQMSAGKHLAALATYEAALACKPEDRIERLAFMAACNAANVKKAREHWGKLSASSRPQVLQICVRNGITKDQLDPCDADALMQKAMTNEQIGQHGAALAVFEAAIACHPSARLYQLAFMTACNAKNVEKARLYWVKIPRASGQQLKQICVRNGITEQTLDGL